VSDGEHQIPQGNEAHHECSQTDECRRGNRPKVNPARAPCPDGEGDAVHGGEEGDGRHCGGTDLDGDARKVWEHRMRDVAEQADRGRPDQKAPEEADSTMVVPAGDPQSASSSLPPDDEVDCDRLLGHLNDDLSTGAERAEVRREGADQHVVLALDLTDLGLPDAKVGGQLDLGQTGGPAYPREINHHTILLVWNTTYKECP